MSDTPVEMTKEQRESLYDILDSMSTCRAHLVTSHGLLSGKLAEEVNSQLVSLDKDVFAMHQSLLEQFTTNELRAYVAYCYVVDSSFVDLEYALMRCYLWGRDKGVSTARGELVKEAVLLNSGYIKSTITSIALALRSPQCVAMISEMPVPVDLTVKRVL